MSRVDQRRTPQRALLCLTDRSFPLPLCAPAARHLLQLSRRGSEYRCPATRCAWTAALYSLPDNFQVESLLRLHASLPRTLPLSVSAALSSLLRLSLAPYSLARSHRARSHPTGATPASQLSWLRVLPPLFTQVVAVALSLFFFFLSDGGEEKKEKKRCVFERGKSPVRKSLSDSKLSRWRLPHAPKKHTAFPVSTVSCVSQLTDNQSFPSPRTEPGKRE